VTVDRPEIEPEGAGGDLDATDALARAESDAVREAMEIAVTEVRKSRHAKKAQSVSETPAPEAVAEQAAAGAPEEPAEAGSDAGGSADAGRTGAPAKRAAAVDAIEATEVRIGQGVVGGITGDRVTVRQGIVGGVMGSRVELERGVAGGILADRVTISQGGAWHIAGAEVSVKEGGAWTVMGWRVSLGRGSFAGAVLAANVDGEVRTLLDWRGVLVVVLGVLGLAWLLRRR
jgi:hypothetical protein